MNTKGKAVPAKSNSSSRADSVRSAQVVRPDSAGSAARGAVAGSAKEGFAQAPTRQTGRNSSLSKFFRRLSLYNPFEHRNIENPSSTIRSFANLLKASLGTGILAMPLAFANSGWLVGLVGTVVIGFICGHCVHIFVTASRKCCKKDRVPVLGYAETCRSTVTNGPERIKKYANFATIFANFALISTYIGVCCIYTVLVADSIQQPLDEYLFARNTSGAFYCIAVMVVLSLIVQVKHLKFLAVYSIIANVLLSITFIICLYYIFREGIQFEGTRNAIGEIGRYPAYLSTVIFAMEGIGVVMPVENNMKTPEHFLGCPGVLVIAMIVICFMYIILGLFGYLRYGQELRGSITLNLPIDEWPALIAKCFIALSILFTYPLTFFVIIDTIRPFLERHMTGNFLAQVFIRIAVVFLCGIIGVFLPMLEQIINIVGAVFYSLLGLVIPAAVDTVACWDHLGRFRWVLWKNVLIVLFGLGCMISGLTVSILDIIHEYNNLKK